MAYPTYEEYVAKHPRSGITREDFEHARAYFLTALAVDLIQAHADVDNVVLYGDGTAEDGRPAPDPGPYISWGTGDNGR